MTGQGEAYKQHCEGVMDVVYEQKAWSDVPEREHKIDKTGPKQGHLQHLDVGKEVPIKHHYKETSKPFLGNRYGGVPL